jgi:hypothetical protein
MCWYVGFELSSRDIEELMAERCVNVDHATINRWQKREHHVIGREQRLLHAQQIRHQRLRDGAVLAQHGSNASSTRLKHCTLAPSSRSAAAYAKPTPSAWKQTSQRWGRQVSLPDTPSVPL